MFSRLAAFILMFFATFANATVVTQTTTIGDDDGFDGTQSTDSNPGDSYLVNLLPFIPPGTYVDEEGIDAETTSPWNPYVFEFNLAYDLSDWGGITEAIVVIQHGSVGRREGGGGYGYADVEADIGGGPVELGDFFDLIASQDFEESVKASTFDVTDLLTPNSSGVLTLTIDGTTLPSPIDQFSIDFVELRATGVFCPVSEDADGDGVADADDNCVTIANADQRDSNGDGYGNVCDPDLNNNELTNFEDLVLFSSAFLSSPGAANWNPDADFNGDDQINFLDLFTLSDFFLQPPGTSCTVF